MIDKKAKENKLLASELFSTINKSLRQLDEVELQE